MLKLITAATTLAVSVVRAQQRLKIGAEDAAGDPIVDSDDNADVEALIEAAMGVFEGRTHLVLQPSDWELRLDHWPTCAPRCIAIPSAPVRDVTGVSYIDEDGVEQSIAQSGDNWTWERTTEGAVLWFRSDFELPTIDRRHQAVRVQFSAGFDPPDQSGSGDDPELVLPPQAELALLYLVGTWTENRESVAKAQAFDVPHTFDLLIEGLKVFR